MLQSEVQILKSWTLCTRVRSGPLEGGLVLRPPGPERRQPHVDPALLSAAWQPASHR